ncbi:MAG TPA: hypothetical protein VH762_02685 [Gemmatimonadaceae bacterium]|jgi:hypothetical protein
MRPKVLCLLLALAPATAFAQPNFNRPPSLDSTARPAANPADVSSPDAIIKAVYDVISGPAGQKRDWDRMRSLFVPNARLMPAVPRPGGAGTAVIVLSVDDYINRSGPQLEANGFFEREIKRVSETYGAVTHIFSTYESRRLASDEKPFARGINSFQLLKDGDRWWVVSIYWQGENAATPIPAKYLP